MQEIKNKFTKYLQPQIKNQAFFKIPHWFEENYGKKLRPSEKYFYIILRKLSNHYANKKTGEFWHVDKTFITKEYKSLGFQSFGFSISTCKRARKKLKELCLIETRYAWNEKYYRTGTFYKLIE